MVIINPIANDNNLHEFEYRSWETENWNNDWIVVPTEFERSVVDAEGYGILTIEDGTIVDFTPTEKPTPTPIEDDEESATWADMATAIAEGVNEV